MRVILRRPSEQLVEYEVDGLPVDATDREVLDACQGKPSQPGVRVRLVQRCDPLVGPASIWMRGEPDLARAGRRLADARALWAEVVGEAKRAASAADRAGASERRIADQLGVNRNTLRAWLGKPRST